MKPPCWLTSVAVLVPTLLCSPFPSRTLAQAGAPSVGIFDGHRDIGEVAHPGSLTYDKATGQYQLTGGGENMWFARDEFHFAWTQATGDVALEAVVNFVGQGANPHRKVCLMIRQDLDPDSPYVDVALHGDGLTSLQFREKKGGNTHEVQSSVKGPDRLRIVKQGKYALMYLGSEGQDLAFSGAAVRLAFNEPFLVGIGVCSHDDSVAETAVFSNVKLTTNLPAPTGKPTLHSTLETQSISSTDRRVVFVTTDRIEAPNWLSDGLTLVYNSQGRLFQIPAEGGKPQAIDTGFATRCNNDHGVSPDGTRLAISDQSQPDRKSRIYTLPVSGGTPTLVTAQGPSYWHGWSPDGKTLAYCAERNGEFDIYTTPVQGGEEKRLTTAKGLDDGPEYSPDGQFLYFNSERSGSMQIWRMRPDGTDQQPVTSDRFNNWFPHPSPDGKRLVFLSYEEGVTGHPADLDVTLRIMNLEDGQVQIIGKFLGGQGTVNVPCWSPDSKQIAFVTYQLTF